MLTVVPHPLEALQELKLVCRPQGSLWLLEFMRSDSKLIGFVQDLITPLASALYNANVGRGTVKLVQRSGFTIVEVEQVVDGIVRIIRATPS